MGTSPGRTTHSEIAAKFSISRQRVGQVIADMTPAAWGFTERDRAQIRAKESAVLERMAKKVEAVISDPPLVHSAIAKTVKDPWCPGSHLINESSQRCTSSWWFWPLSPGTTGGDQGQGSLGSRGCLRGLGCPYCCWSGSVWLRASTSAMYAGCPTSLPRCSASWWRLRTRPWPPRAAYQPHRVSDFQAVTCGDVSI